MMIVVTLFYTFISTNSYVRIFIDGMQAGVCAMLLDVMLGLFSGVAKRNNVIYYILMVISFLYVRFTDHSIFFLAMLCIAIAIVKVLMTAKAVKHD